MLPSKPFFVPKFETQLVYLNPVLLDGTEWEHNKIELLDDLLPKVKNCHLHNSMVESE